MKAPTKRLLGPARIIAVALIAGLAVALAYLRFAPDAVGEKERQVSADLAAQLQETLDSAVESPKTIFPGTALYVSQPELGTWAGAAGKGTIDPATPMRQRIRSGPGASRSPSSRPRSCS